MIDFSSFTPTEWAFVIGLFVAGFSLTAFCIVDILKKDGLDSLDRMIWVQVCAFIPFLGATAYLLFGRKKGEQNQ